MLYSHTMNEDKVKKASLISFMKTCRLCAKLKDVFIHIFQEQGQNLDILIKIRECLQIEMPTDDALPTVVCSECCKKLLETFEFFQQAKNAQIVLQSMQKVDDCLTSNHKETPETLVESTDSVWKEEDICSDYTLNKEPSFEAVTVDSRLNRSEDAKSGKRVYLASTYSWHCTDCSIVLENPRELKNHHQNVHQQPVKYQCLQCNKIYTVYRKFSRHVRLHRNEGKFRCEECLKGFSTRQSLDAHVVLHSNARPFSCRECGRSFRQASTLHSHHLTHAPGCDIFACPQCKKMMSSQQSLKHHLLSHTGSKNFMCEICGKGFSRKQTLQHHLLTHAEGKTVICQMCCKRFKTQQQLQSHLLVHSCKRSFQCDVCGRQFRLLTTLTVHFRVHSGEKPFKCEFCGQCFRFRGVYMVHRRKHTGERPYVCSVCGWTFSNYANHAKHIKRHCQKTQEDAPNLYMNSSVIVQMTTRVNGAMVEKDSVSQKSSSFAATSVLAANDFTAMTFSPIVPHHQPKHINSIIF